MNLYRKLYRESLCIQLKGLHHVLNSDSWGQQVKKRIRSIRAEPTSNKIL